MNRKLKRTISTILSVFMIIGLISINVSVSATDNVYANESVLLNYDFETDKIVTLNTALEKTEESDIYGYSLKYIPHDKNAPEYSSLSIPVPKNAGEYTVSFDFMLPQTDHLFKMLLRSGSTTGSYTDFGAIHWDQNGNIVASIDGRIPWGLKTGFSPDGASGFKTIAKYEANKWHNITFRYIPDKANTILNYYLDGKYVESSTMKEKQATDGYLKNIYFGSARYGGINEYGSTETFDGDGTEALYIDNFVVTCDNADYSYGNANVNGNDIRYYFTEGLENSDILNNVSLLNTETGENVQIQSASSNNRSGVITPAQELESDVEYCIVIPKDAKSASGKIYMTIFIFRVWVRPI